MGSWRMDVAPAAMTPHLSRAQALALFQSSDAGRMTKQPNTTTTLRFGLFSGNAPNPNAPDGRLTGSHPIGPLPGWIALVDGVEMLSSGGGVPPGMPSSPKTPVKGYALIVISDQDGRDLSGLEEVGGGSASSTGIE